MTRVRASMAARAGSASGDGDDGRNSYPGQAPTSPWQTGERRRWSSPVLRSGSRLGRPPRSWGRTRHHLCRNPNAIRAFSRSNPLAGRDLAGFVGRRDAPPGKAGDRTGCHISRSGVWGYGCGREEGERRRRSPPPQRRIGTTLTRLSSSGPVIFTTMRSGHALRSQTRGDSHAVASSAPSDEKIR